MPQVIKRTGAVLLLALLVLAGLALTSGRGWLEGQLQPVRPGATDLVVYELAAGASTLDVAESLHARELIKSPAVFRYYARYLGLDSQLKPGQYQLSPGMTPEQILRKLARGEVIVYRFTVPEGLTVKEMAKLLAEKKLVDHDRFLEAAASLNLAQEYVPPDGKLEQPLEGYLFPDTYEYKPGIKEEEILALMFGHFKQLFTPEMRQRAEELGMTVHQVVTLASIVEKEAQVAEERPVIAGVYHNRLKVGMKLDADPSVLYGLGKAPYETLLYKDLEVDTPYNTYMNPGLPPGPIAAPGLAALKATLYPTEHDFWFFVAKGDGSGEHYFAETYDEHMENIAKSDENRKKEP